MLVSLRLPHCTVMRLGTLLHILNEREEGKRGKGGGGGGGRPLTRGRQRGYYSEVVGSEALQRLGVSMCIE